MKKYFRVMSVFVLFTFLFNGVVLDPSESFGMGEKSTLSPVLKFSSLAGIEPKEMAKVEFMIETALLEAAAGDSELSLNDMRIRANKDYAYTNVFDETHTFFAEREELTNGRIMLMTRILRNKNEKALRTYYAVFSTKKVDGGFNIDVYTEKEWKENEALIRQGKDLPKRVDQKPNDAKAIARYINDNEKIIDSFIRKRVYADDFAEIKGRAETLWGTSRHGTVKPQVEFPEKYLEFIKDKLNGFLGDFGTSVDEALDGKNLVFIRVPEGSDYPVIYEKDPASGKMVLIPVRSHTSQNAVYIFLDNYTFDSLKDPEVRWDLVINAEVLSRLLYEIGVIYGLPYEVIDEMGIKGTMNDLLHAYNALDSGTKISQIKKYFSNLQLNQKVNLDETLWTRDYFMAEKLGYVQSDVNVEALAKAIAEEFYKEPDEEKQGQILLEVERLLTIYSLKAIMWHLMAPDQLTSLEQLDTVETGREKLWARYTTIPSSLDTFLREKIIEWINVQAQTNGSALRKELYNSTIVSKAYSGPPSLYVSAEQEKKIIDSIQKPVFNAIFGVENPGVFLEEKNFLDKIKGYTEKEEEKDKGSYWYAVEKDLRRLIEEGKVAKITKDGRIVNVKTGEEVYAGNLGIKQANKIKKLIKAIKSQVRFMKDEDKSTDYFNGFGSSVIQDWGKTKHEAITKTEVAPSSWFDDSIGKKLVEYVKELSTGVEEMEVYMVLDSAYASPSTKEFVHVGRGFNRIWFGERFLMEAQRRADEDTDATIDVMSRLFIDEEQHAGKDGVNHGMIEKEEDIGKVVDHMMTSWDKKFLSDITRDAWEKSMKGKMPWEPLLEGGTVGKSAEFVKFFEDLKEFAENDMKRTALVLGSDGNGKTKVVDAVSEMMKTGRDRVIRIDCRTFKHFTTTPDKAYEVLFGKGTEDAGAVGRALEAENALLVIDNFHELVMDSPQAEMVMSILNNVKRGESILSSESKELDTKRLKVLCLANSEVSEFQKKSLLETQKIWEGIQATVTLPKLTDREDDVLRMAEYFNFEACKLRKIDYAPMDECVGNKIMEIVKEDTAISIWDIKMLIENIVANRAKTESSSNYLITHVDMYSIDESIRMALPKLAKLWSSEKVEEIETYYGRLKKLLPYFKEFVENDKMDNPIGFYKGPRGEQPGLPRGRGSRRGNVSAYQLIRAKPEKDNSPGDARNNKKLETLTNYANIVGKLIAPPVSCYTLFTAYDLATDEEYDADIKEYRSRFKLERIPTDKPEDIIEKILDVIDEKELRGENIIVQLPEEFSIGNYGVSELMEAVPRIRFMVIDTKGLKEEKNAENRKLYRDVIYNMMRLARNIDENPDLTVSILLNYFVDYCFDNTMDSSMREASINRYLDAISHNRILEMLNTVLSYKYMIKHTLPGKELIVKTLVSA